jgi:hypothetical protein
MQWDSGSRQDTDHAAYICPRMLTESQQRHAFLTRRALVERVPLDRAILGWCVYKFHLKDGEI